MSAHRRRTCLVPSLILVAAVAVAWILIQGPIATYLRGQQAPAPQASDGPRYDPSFLPPGTVLFDTLQADLDDDGSPETVLFFNDQEKPYGPGRGGVVLLAGTPGGDSEAHEHRPPSEGRVTDAAIRDINLDGILELLIYKSSEDETDYYLSICQWDGSNFVTLGPHGEPLDGAQVFMSKYYPPEVRNVDSTAMDEIVAFEDDIASERLKVIVYRWNGDAYTQAHWIVMMGPPGP